MVARFSRVKSVDRPTERAASHRALPGSRGRVCRDGRMSGFGQPPPGHMPSADDLQPANRPRCVRTTTPAAISSPEMTDWTAPVTKSRALARTRVDPCPPFHRVFSTRRSGGGNDWSWGGDDAPDALGKPSASATRAAPGGLQSLGGLSIHGSSHPGEVPGPGRQAGGSNRRGTIIRGPAASSRTARPASLTGVAHAASASHGHAASGAVHVQHALSLELDPASIPRASATAMV